ncbi:MAG: hypothetical protein R3C10_01930 [Pirellulales bacterium]
MDRLSCGLVLSLTVFLTTLLGCGRSADQPQTVAQRDGATAPTDDAGEVAPHIPADTLPGDGNAAPTRPRSISPRNRPHASGDDEPQTSLIRTIDDALEDVDTSDEDVNKDDLRQMLYEADRELRDVLGGKAKEAIMRANRKPPSRYRDEPAKPIDTPPPGAETTTPESSSEAAPAP